MKNWKIWIGSLILFLYLMLSLTCDFDSTDLGSNFIYNDEHRHIIGKVDIPPRIISYDYDNQFIIVKQKPDKYNNVIYDKREYVYPLGRDTIYYWIIIKAKEKVIGPLDFDKYKELKKEYHVSKDLILE